MNTPMELALDRVATILKGATDARDSVFRDRADSLESGEEVPAIRVLRGALGVENFGDQTERVVPVFKLEFIVKGEGREAALDQLHAQAHKVMLADVVLQGMGRGLRCMGTDEPDHFFGSPTVAHMTATYQFQTLCYRDNFASAVKG